MYALPVGQYSNKKEMNYSLNKLFNTLRSWRVNIFIIMFLVWMILQQRIISNNYIVNWLLYLTLTKISIHRLLMWCALKELGKGWETYCVIMMQWGNMKGILNVKKKLGEKSNKLRNYKKKREEFFFWNGRLYE